MESTDVGYYRCEGNAAASYWIAVQVRPNHERTTAEHFALWNHEHFLPTYRVRRKWCDRMKELELPLFPGYVFCRYEAGVRWRILSTAGVVRILGYGGCPAEVNEEEITAIARITQSGYDCEPLAYIQTGDRVRIDAGPLKGLTGVVVKAKPGRQRFITSVTLLQRSVSVEVDGDSLSPITPLLQLTYARRLGRIAPPECGPHLGTTKILA